MKRVWWVVAIVAATAGTATAEPCPVTIVRAPDAVRPVVAQWLAQEARCKRLEVRIVATDEGLYVLARDDRGRLHERVVPNADAAGVLIASWAADDELAAPGPDPVAAIAALPTAPAVTMPPGEAPVLAQVAPAPRGDPRWLTVGGLIGASDGGGFGVRAELDVATARRFSLGVIGSWSQNRFGANTDSSNGVVQTNDTKVLAALARTVSLGQRWDLRTSMGAGIVYTSALYHRWEGNQFLSGIASGTFPTAEAGVRVARTFDRWAIGFGPVVTLFAQDLSAPQSGGMQSEILRRGLELAFYAAIAHRM